MSKESSKSEGLVFAAALLYQKVESDRTLNNVQACLLPCDDGDDEWSRKAKAERYFNDHEDIAPRIKDMNLVAWSFSVQVEG